MRLSKLVQSAKSFPMLTHQLTIPPSGRTGLLPGLFHFTTTFTVWKCILKIPKDNIKARIRAINSFQLGIFRTPRIIHFNLARIWVDNEPNE